MRGCPSSVLDMQTLCEKTEDGAPQAASLQARSALCLPSLEFHP